MSTSAGGRPARPASEPATPRGLLTPCAHCLPSCCLATNQPVAGVRTRPARLRRGWAAGALSLASGGPVSPPAVSAAESEGTGGADCALGAGGADGIAGLPRAPLSSGPRTRRSGSQQNRHRHSDSRELPIRVVGRTDQRALQGSSLLSNQERVGSGLSRGGGGVAVNAFSAAAAETGSQDGLCQWVACSGRPVTFHFWSWVSSLVKSPV